MKARITLLALFSVFVFAAAGFAAPPVPAADQAPATVTTAPAPAAEVAPAAAVEIPTEVATPDPTALFAEPFAGILPAVDCGSGFPVNDCSECDLSCFCAKFRNCCYC